MTRHEHEVHEKQAETSAELWAEGAKYVRDIEKETGKEVKGAPRLEITAEQYDRILGEMADAFAGREKETQEFREGLDKFLAELLRLRRTPWGAAPEGLPGETPENPMSSVSYYDLMDRKEMHFRGFVESVEPNTNVETVGYRDVQREEIEGAPDLLLDVEGILAENGVAAEDIEFYEARLMVNSKKASRAIYLGTIQFTGDLTELDAANKAFVGDMFFAMWRAQIKKIAGAFRGDRSEALDRALLKSSDDNVAPAIATIAEDTLKVQKAGHHETPS